MTRAVLGVIVGNRDFFPDHLVTSARREVTELFGQMNIEAVILGEGDTELGGVETYADARRCAELLGANRDRLDGVLVVLPNFGDEKGVAEALRLAGTNVPVLVQAYPDELDRLDAASRRDGFCGKISVCSNLRQYGIPFSLTRGHVTSLTGEGFREDLERFINTCRVVKGLRSARIGAVGARPGAFNTVRYSEKILEAEGVTVTTVDLSEVLAGARKLADADGRVVERLEKIRSYADAGGVPAEKLTRMAKLAVVLSDWVAANDLDATAVQCWTSIQENYGVNPCLVMSMMSENLLPSACEADVTGALSMYALQLASGSPSALADWNNNYGDDENKCVLFHCGNWPRASLQEARIGTAPILGTVVGEENTCGALDGRTAAGPLTYVRLGTDDCRGATRAYVGEGRFTDDPLATFGCRAVVEVPKLQKLMRYVCRNGFEHHVAVNASRAADALAEALETYLGWVVYYHERPGE